MTLVVRARIEVDKGSAQADLRQASEAVKQVGDANREAATGAAALTSATNTMSSAQREAAQAVRGEAAAQDEATRAKIANTAAAGRQRAAYQQLGFQVQDVFQQFALGINPLVILAQQGGQVTSAFALMGEGAGGAQSKFTRFMTFLSGPWGAALLGAVTIGGLLAQTLWDNEDAADGATQANDAYASAQSQLAKVMNLTTGEISSQNVVLREQIRLLAQKQIVEGRRAEREARESLQDVGRPGLFTLFGANDRRRAEFESSTRPVRQLTEDLIKGRIAATEFRKEVDRLEKAGRLGGEDAIDVVERGLNLAIAQQDQLVGQQMLDALDGRGLAAGLRRDAPKGRTAKKDNSADKAAREAQRLLDFTGAAEERKGVDGAADRLADLNRRLIQLSRDAYGTAGSEYASDRAQAIASAERIIQIENDRIRGTQEAAAETNRQLSTANQLSNEQNNILAEINAGIRTLITSDGINIAGGGGGNAGIDLGAVLRQVEVK